MVNCFLGCIVDALVGQCSFGFGFFWSVFLFHLPSLQVFFWCLLNHHPWHQWRKRKRKFCLCTAVVVLLYTYTRPTHSCWLLVEINFGHMYIMYHVCHFFEQYLTFVQLIFHFFLQVKSLLQEGQILVGKSFFFIL